jgi:hypothetical protein
VVLLQICLFYLSLSLNSLHSAVTTHQPIILLMQQASIYAVYIYCIWHAPLLLHCLCMIVFTFWDTNTHRLYWSTLTLLRSIYHVRKEQHDTVCAKFYYSWRKMTYSICSVYCIVIAEKHTLPLHTDVCKDYLTI